MNGRRSMGSRAVAVAFTGAMVVATGCGVDSALVGGACATGYTDCNNVCVRTSSDPDNCGTCGDVCSSGKCVSGMCTTHADAQVDAKADAPADAKADARLRTDASDGATDGTTDVTVVDSSTDASFDARHRGDAADGGDASPSDASRSDAAVTDAKAADGRVGDAPVTDGNATDGGADAADSASTVCTPPLFACGGTCITGTSDPDNCGACGKVCLSGICVNGVCAGSTSGNIVAIGDDYAATSTHVSAAKVLTNAVFLPASNPLHVLLFEQYADHTQIANVTAILSGAATASGRTVIFSSPTDATVVPADLASNQFDVLLVFDQPNAPAATLGPIGTSWQSSLNTFLLGGGDVVVLDGASGAMPQMSAFLTSANLLATTGESAIASGTQLLNVASGDSVGNSVLSPYAAQADTVSFVTSEANGGAVTYVIDELSGGSLVPVVVHKTVTAP